MFGAECGQEGGRGVSAGVVVSRGAQPLRWRQQKRPSRRLGRLANAPGEHGGTTRLLPSAGPSSNLPSWLAADDDGLPRLCEVQVREDLVAHGLVHFLGRLLTQPASAQMLLAGEEHRVLNRSAGDDGLALRERLQVVEAP